MKKWEYKVFTSRTLGEGAAQLDGLGTEGWEMIGTQKDHNEHVMFFFKRKLRTSKTEPHPKTPETQR